MAGPLILLLLSQVSPPPPCNNIFCHGGNDGCSGNLCEGDGDCDKDTDCAGPLLCGTDNCKVFRDPSMNWDGVPCDAPGWDATDDCCYTPGGVGSPTDTRLQHQCQGTDDGCQKAGRLQLGDGDCDSNDECAQGLVCGTDNCAAFRDSFGWPCDADYGWDRTDDCCYLPGGIGDPSVNTKLTGGGGGGSDRCPQCPTCPQCAAQGIADSSPAVAVAVAEGVLLGVMVLGGMLGYTFSCPSSWSGAVRGALKINRAQPGPAMSGVTPLAGADYAAAR